jgi:hypothetical protein
LRPARTPPIIGNSPPRSGGSVLAEAPEFDTATKKHQQGDSVMFKASHLFYVVIAAVFAVTPVMSMAAEKADAKKGAIVLTDSAYAKATVVNIKKKERELTLRDEKGVDHVMIAGDDVRNFAQIKKGDIVEVEYHVAVASALEKASDATVAGQTSAVERAPAGAKPGMAAMQTRTIVATVLEESHAYRAGTKRRHCDLQSAGRHENLRQSEEGRQDLRRVQRGDCYLGEDAGQEEVTNTYS